MMISIEMTEKDLREMLLDALRHKFSGLPQALESRDITLEAKPKDNVNAGWQDSWVRVKVIK